jgi:hypothetical protein
VLNGFLKGAPTAAMRALRSHVPAVVFEDFVIVGRRSGKQRRLLLSLYDIDGTWYVGHPNGTSQWVLNLVAAGGCTVTRRDGRAIRVSAVEVVDPEERERVVRTTGMQPAPAGLIYRGARAHVRAAGRFFRLTPIEDAGDPGASG